MSRALRRSPMSPVVLITGALTGIGRATAFAFAQEGARVVVSGRRDDAGEALATELRAAGAEVEFIRADVRHDDGKLRRHLRYQRARRAPEHEARITSDAGAGKRQHRQPVVDHGPSRRVWGIALYRQQTRG